MIPSLSHSWSELTWQQLCMCWEVKIRYGRNPDVARAAALLALMDTTVSNGKKGLCVKQYGTSDGEQRYLVSPRHNGKGKELVITPRELAYYAKKALPWFDFPYGDMGEKEQHDDKGNIIKEGREGVPGYVGPMRDAMILPIDNVKIRGSRVKEFRCGSKFSIINGQFSMGARHFALPQVACNNITWQQYRSVQVIIPELFSDTAEERAIELQAKFLAHILSPRSFALFDTTGGNIKFRPHYVYQYNAERAEELAQWFQKNLKSESAQGLNGKKDSSLLTLFHICFQTYQTAVQYYNQAYPLLFSDDGKKDTMRDALTGEVSTINTIMVKAGYSEQQQVYDSNLPFVLDILNTMAKEAKDIEQMNARMKRRT